MSEQRFVLEERDAEEVWPWAPTARGDKLMVIQALTSKLNADVASGHRNVYRISPA